MRKSYIKADIRLSKILTRPLKSSYKMLSLHEKSFVKALEAKIQFEKEIGIMERRDKNWRCIQDGQDLLGHYSKSIDKLQRARLFFEEKTGKDLTEYEELALLSLTRRNRFYGGSF